MKSIGRGLGALVVVVLLSIVTAQMARADIAAFTFQDPVSGTVSVTGNDGFKFQPNVDILVTALGYYDRDQDGLALTHPIAIFDADSQSLLATTTVGLGSSLDGSFRYSLITPLLLQQGQSYMVVGFHPGSLTQDLAAENPTGVTTATEITYQGYFFSYDTALSYPAMSGGSGTFFGPSFRFAIDADGDGVFDNADDCPASDLRATVVIGACDSGVPNAVFASGCTISDLVAECDAASRNRGQFMTCVMHLTNDLKNNGTITGKQQGEIHHCATGS